MKTVTYMGQVFEVPDDFNENCEHRFVRDEEAILHHCYQKCGLVICEAI